MSQDAKRANSQRKALEIELENQESLFDNEEAMARLIRAEATIKAESGYGTILIKFDAEKKDEIKVSYGLIEGHQF